MKQKQTRRTDLWLPRGMGAEEGMDWEFGIIRSKLVCIRWINHEVLLYSARNYIHYSTIDHNGKQYEKE